VISFNYKQTWNRHRRPANFSLPKRWGGRKPSVVLFGDFKLFLVTYLTHARLLLLLPRYWLSNNTGRERDNQKRKRPHAHYYYYHPVAKVPIQHASNGTLLGCFVVFSPISAVSIVCVTTALASFYVHSRFFFSDSRVTLLSGCWFA
jgi:hypothetical protein